jgi:hypothetical protein
VRGALHLVFQTGTRVPITKASCDVTDRPHIRRASYTHNILVHAQHISAGDRLPRYELGIWDRVYEGL